jgi:hypothetical protein
MLRLSILVIAPLIINPAASADAETLACVQASNLSAARLSWAAVRKNHIDPAHKEESCRSYAESFFGAVTARQAASFCKDGIERERTLELLDFEIGAFNDLIATLCSS